MSNPPADKPRGVIAMTTLGRNGRFGNQLFQYAFLRLYALEHQLEVRTPPWVGQYLFGHKDPGVDELRLPMLDDHVGAGTTINHLQAPVINVDVCGWFQYHTSWYRPWRHLFRDLFRPVKELAGPLDSAVAGLRSGGRTLVGVHVRRGDFNGGIHFAAPIEWYLRWLRENWNSWHDPVLYVATDDSAGILPQFAEFRPKTAADIPVQVTEASYFVDHYVLSQCDAMALSNSSFSFSAAMLNARAKLFVRPKRSTGGLVAFDPWDSDPMLSELAKDEQAAYYEDTCAGILQSIEKLKQNPSQADAQEKVRSGRWLLADLWLGMNEDTLRIAYNALGKAQRALLSDAVRGIGLTAAEQNHARELSLELKRGLSAVWGIQYLLAAMLYHRPSDLPMPHDLLAIPQWLLCDYLSYLRGLPESA